MSRYSTSATNVGSTPGKFAEVAVPPEQVECVVDQPVLFARSEFGLELGEIGAALMDDHHFSVEDRLAGISNASAITEKRFVQSNPLRVNTRFFALSRWTCTR